MYSFSAICDLAGGFSIGASYALGDQPQDIVGYKPFLTNDSISSAYWQKPIVEPSAMRQADIIVATPPCAGLSNANLKADGSNPTNEWITKVMMDGLTYGRPQVMVIENAPTLVGLRGVPVRQKMEALASELGYSVSYYKTTTDHHGIPQKRPRTFALIWQGDRVPKLNRINKPHLNLREYLASHTQQGQLLSQPSQDDLSLLNLLTPDHIDQPPLKSEYLVTMAMKRGRAAEALAAVTVGGSRHRLISHAMEKASRGLNFFDNSPKVFGDIAHAWMHRHCNAISPLGYHGLHVSDGLALMGLPADYLKWITKRNINLTCQTVPTCTARDIITEVAEALDGNRLWSEKSGFTQSNI